ncbi:uncharacterized protein VTP21DRAFT_4480 [Calcarisporiella thermophila]|uniref:uncharacterized protein n=1 Tax=Calcarisporiella thermophila TaxID=911321 RepID=UPI003743D454
MNSYKVLLLLLSLPIPVLGQKFAIVSPTENTLWRPGQIATVLWEPQDDSASSSLDTIRFRVVAILADSVSAAKQSYNWAIPKDTKLQPSQNYVISLYDVTTEAVVCMSDTFTIAEQSSSEAHMASSNLPNSINSNNTALDSNPAKATSGALSKPNVYIRGQLFIEYDSN